MATPPSPPPSSPPPATPGAGSVALIAALVASATVAAALLLGGEVLRIQDKLVSDRVFAPRLARRTALAASDGVADEADAEVDAEAEAGAKRSTVPTELPSTSPFAWLGPVLRATDDDLLSSVGLDATLYVKFARTALHVLCYTFVWDIIVIMWANHAGSNKIPGQSDMDPFTIGHLQRGTKLYWLHWVSISFKTAAVLRELFLLSAWVAKAQEGEAARRLGAPEARALLVTDVPSLGAAAATLAAVYGADFLALTPVVDPRPAAKLAARRLALLSQLEAARAKLAKSKAAPPARPTHRTGMCGLTGERVDTIAALGAELAGVEARLDAARAAALRPVAAAADGGGGGGGGAEEEGGGPGGGGGDGGGGGGGDAQPQQPPHAAAAEPRAAAAAPGPPAGAHRRASSLTARLAGGGGGGDGGGDGGAAGGAKPGGDCGGGGGGCSCPDAPARPAGLAFFSTPRAAAVASQVALGRDLEFRVAKAPPAGDIAWGNLARVPALHQPLVSSAWRLLLCAVVAFYMVPIAAVSAVSTLANLSSLLPFLKPAIAIPVVNGILSGILPTLALLIFLALLPTLVGGIAWASGLATQSQADVYVLSGLFLFYVVNVFLGAVLAQSVLSALKAITADPPSVVKLLATTIPGTSRFFIAFVALKAGSLVAGTTVLVNNVVYRALRLLAGARNTRADEAAWLPQPILLAVNVADMLLVWLLVLIFTTLAPIMYGAGFLYFGARLLEAKTSVLYRHEPLYESAARWWPAARHRVVFSLYCAQLTLVLVVALKQAPGPAVLTAALVPLTALGSDLMRRSYDSFAPHNPQPLQQYPGGAAALADVAPLAAAYLPLALQPPEGPLREELQAELAAAAAEKAAAEAAAKAAAVGPAPPGDEELGKQD